MACLNFSCRTFLRTAWGVMPSTLGCVIPAHREKALGERHGKTWEGGAALRSLTSVKLLFKASLLTCVHVRLHLRSMRHELITRERMLRWLS